MKLEEFARESRATHKGDKSGVPIVGLEHLIPQEIKFSGYDVDTENTFTKTFKKGQILFGRRRAYLKKAAIADFDGICSGDITVIEAIPGKVDPLLLPFIIQNDKFFDYAVSRSAGGLSPRVKWEHLKDYEFDLPPIEEQRILADKLWAAYRLKESYKKLLTATQEMVKSQFIEMFGDTHMRSDHSRQWKEVVEIINGKDYKSIQVEDGGYPVYGTGGEMARASDYLSPANSILLGRKGTIDKPLLIREKYWNVDTAFGAVPDEKVLHYVYFYWHCKTIDFNVLNKGTTLPSTTKVDLLNLWIKIPSMEEQTRFGSIVEQADKSEFVGCKSQFFEMFEGDEYPLIKLGDYTDLTWGDTNTTK
ncbi:MAG: restriction endonuclease subunit S, partial [Fervidobacterium sp.]|nr:restriction endonuclease subunit S [Fervidobacterium sp.]